MRELHLGLERGKETETERERLERKDGHTHIHHGKFRVESYEAVREVSIM